MQVKNTEKVDYKGYTLYVNESEVIEGVQYVSIKNLTTFDEYRFRIQNNSIIQLEPKPMTNNSYSPAQRYMVDKYGTNTIKYEN